MFPKKHSFILFCCLAICLLSTTKASAFDLGAIGQCIASQASNLLAGQSEKNSYIGSCLIEGFGPDGVDLCKQYAGGLWSTADCDRAYASVQAGAQAVQGGITTTVQAGQDAWTCMSTDPIACANDFLASTGVTDPNLTKVAMLTGQAHFDMGIDSLPDELKDAGITRILLTKAPLVIDGSDLCKTLVRGWYAGTTTLGALAVSGPDGRWLAAVPACGKITYTLQPENAAFNWTPGERVVTLGGDMNQNQLPANQPSAQVGVAAPASMSQAATPAQQTAKPTKETKEDSSTATDNVQKENNPSSEITGSKITKPAKKITPKK